MADRPFADNAEKYWEKGLDVVPCKPGTKRPSIPNWQGFLTNQPSQKTRKEWTQKLGDHGLCLLTGGEVLPGYQLVAFDVDDDKLVPFIKSMLVDCPCAKRGKKGLTIFALVPKSDNIKSTTIRGGEGLGNIDFLAGGRCTVLPPTIHPDTGKSYNWIGVPITDVDYQMLPIVDKATMELLKAVVGSDHAAVVISGKETNNASVSLSAQLVAKGFKDDEIIRVFGGLLPQNYNGNTMQELPKMIASAREKGFDQKSNKKAKQSTQALELLAATGYELYNDQNGDAFIKFRPQDRGVVAYPVRSSATEAWISYQYYNAMGEPISNGPQKEVLAALEAKAKFNSPKKSVHVRFGLCEGNIYIDRGSDDAKGSFVEISKLGWKLIDETPALFWRPEGFESFAPPRSGGSINDLKSILNFDDRNYKLLIAYMINCYNPYGPFMALIPQGGKGSGKSMVSSIIKRIIDPSVVERSMLPKNDHDLVIQASQQFLLSIDNVSNVPFNLSDNFCRVLTGSAFVTRRYYTDNESRIFRLERPIILNGIGNFINAADLLERSIQINLEPIPPGMSKTERQMEKELARLLPGFMGALFDCVSYGLANIDKVEAPTNIRMADAAHFILACEPATGFEPGAMIAAVSDARHEMMTDRIVNDPLFIELCKIIENLDNYHFTGTMGELHEILQGNSDFGITKNWKTPATLSSHITRKADMLRESGLIVELGERKNNGRIVRINVTPELAQTFNRGEF